MRADARSEKGNGARGKGKAPKDKAVNGRSGGGPTAAFCKEQRDAGTTDEADITAAWAALVGHNRRCYQLRERWGRDDVGGSKSSSAQTLTLCAYDNGGTDAREHMVMTRRMPYDRVKCTGWSAPAGRADTRPQCRGRKGWPRGLGPPPAPRPPAACPRPAAELLVRRFSAVFPESLLGACSQGGSL